MSNHGSSNQNCIPLPPNADSSSVYAKAFAPVQLNKERDDAPTDNRQSARRGDRARPGSIHRGADRTRPFRMLLTVVGFVLLAVYGTLAFTAGDLLWFVKQFDSSPALVIIYHDAGQRTELAPADPGFERLVQAIQGCISQGLERPSGIGFSDASLLDAYTRYLTVEAVFQEPVRLHAWFNTEEPTRLLFPITGRHSDLSVMVLGKGGKYLASPPVLKTMEPLRQALRDLGYY